MIIADSILANAYVSGMKEDLHFEGAEYNYLTSFFIIGYCVGQVPSQLILTRSMLMSFRMLFGLISDVFHDKSAHHTGYQHVSFFGRLSLSALLLYAMFEMFSLFGLYWAS